MKGIKRFCAAAWKRILIAALLALLPGVMAGSADAPKSRALTVMVYMCGSNLESEYGSASADLVEMMDAGFDAGKVSLLVMEGGTSAWKSGGDPNQTVIREIQSGRHRVLEKFPAMNMGDSKTLETLLRFGKDRYPADRYALILWNHGGGPLEGVCWDELFSMDRLSLSELTTALARAEIPEKLAWIGFDACLMCSAEVAQAVSPYAEYMIASQETEPATGWDYHFLTGLDPTASGAEAGKVIVDAYFDSMAGSKDLLTMACLDLSKLPPLIEEMDRFFTEASGKITKATFAGLSETRMAAAGFGRAVRGIGDEGYDLVDLKDLVSRSGGDNSALLGAIVDAVAYARSSEEGAGGLSVYHPFQNKAKYLERWGRDYQKLAFSAGYRKYLNLFGDFLTGEDMTDWSGLVPEIAFVSPEGVFQFSLSLTPEQRENLVSAQLMILERTRDRENEGETRITGLCPVSVEPAFPGEDGRLTAGYAWRAMYAVDRDGRVLTGPISFLLAEDGSGIRVLTIYNDYSNRTATKPETTVLYHCTVDEKTQEARIERTYVYDEVSGTYTNRIPFTEEGMTDAYFWLFLRNYNEQEGAIPAFEDWETYGGYLMRGIKLPADWHLRFMDDWQSGNLYAVFQLTDAHQNTWSSKPIPLPNPKEQALELSPDTAEAEGLTFHFSAVLNRGAREPSLSLRMEIENETEKPFHTVKTDCPVADGFRQIDDSFSFYDLEAGQSAKGQVSLHMPDLMGLEEISSLDFTIEIGETGSWDEEPVSVPVHLGISGGQLPDTEPDSSELLSGPETAEGITLQLVSLTPNEDGTISGLLYARNETEEAWFSTGTLVLNRVKMNGNLYVRLKAGADGYFSFRVNNGESVSSFDLSIAGDNRFYLMGVPEALQQAGISEITEAVICWETGSGSASDGSVFMLPFHRPVPLSPAGSTPARQILLENGQIRVEVENILAADNGAALGLRLQNLSGEPYDLKFIKPGMNGAEGDYFIYSQSISLPAGAHAVYCLPFRDDQNEIEALEEVFFSFRIGNSTSSPARLRFPKGTVLGAEGGTLLTADQAEIVPAEMNPQVFGPFLLDRTVYLASERIPPVSAAPPLTSEQMEEMESGSAALCLLNQETVTEADGTETVQWTTRDLTSIPLRKQEDGNWKCLFSGAVLRVSGEYLRIYEEETADHSWLISPNRIYIYGDAKNYPDSGEYLSWEDSYDQYTDTSWTLQTTEAHTEVKNSSLTVTPWSDWHDDRTNIYLSEAAVAALENRVYFGTDRAGNAKTLDYTEHITLPLDQPLKFEMAAAENIPERLGIYFVINYADGTREDYLADYATGEILSSSRMQQWW